MELSVIIPALNEGSLLTETVLNLSSLLDSWKVEYEILLIVSINDWPTWKKSEHLVVTYNHVRLIIRQPTNSFGDSIRTGIDRAFGKIVVFCMADGSEDPADVWCYYAYIKYGYDMLFGSRFSRFSRPEGYPFIKWVLNRIGNKTLQHFTDIRCNDLTNGFKAYKREVLEAVLPLKAQGFDITLEIALKAVMKGYKYTTVSVSWYPRKEGKSKFNILRESWGFIKTFFKTWR